ncbi:MAG: YgiT-type zinc finger protein [Bacteroidota bacterium]|nr:YgiT-type zinc finger protein [Bacteroidota bacterium]
MKCLICGEKLIESREDITKQVLGYTFEFKNVPIARCEKCNELHFPAKSSEFMEKEIAKYIMHKEKFVFEYKD